MLEIPEVEQASPATASYENFSSITISSAVLPSKMSSEPPTFLLAHGAWHQPHLYAPLKQALATLGYSLIVPALPTMGANAIGIGWDSDVKALLDSAEALFSQGKEIILVGHSYGGIPACIATRNNGVLERKSAGQRGGFRQIIFVCAFVMPAVGMSQASLMRHKLPPWQQLIESKGMVSISGSCRYST